jgi:hypothetical protein
MLVIIRSRDGKYLGRRGKESVLVERERALVFDTDKDHVEQQLLTVNSSFGCGWKAEPYHLFERGKLVCTPGVMELMKDHSGEIDAFLQRHFNGDWGDLCDEDRQANQEAQQEGLRLLSAYRLNDGTKLWVITEADRSVTTVLLPEEY